jgi:imidazolonepropionase-like amidohydrolase
MIDVSTSGYFRVAILIAALTMSCLPFASAANFDLQIEHVTVVSPELSSPVRDVTVSIRNGRIVSISREASPLSGPGPGIATEIINGKGLYLAPGLIDSHVHTNNLPGMEPPQAHMRPDVARSLRQQLPRSYLYFGFTTLIDLISGPEQLRAWNAQELHPELYFCGATPIPGGYPRSYASKADQARQFPYMIVQRGEETSAPEGVDPATHTPEAVIKRMKADGAVCVKTFYERGFGEVDELPVPRLDTILALVKAAHAAHMPVFIHANGTDAQEFAVQAGADIIAHGLWHWNREQQATELTTRAKTILDDVVRANMGWQPTMQVLYGERDLFDPGYLSDARLTRVVPASALEWYRSPEGQWFHDILAPIFLPRPVLDSHDPSVKWSAVLAAPIIAAPIARNANATRYMAAHGARFLFGTDTPSAPTYANPPGLNGWLEMRRLIEAGLTPAQVFRAATLTNAEALGLSREIGTVQPGRRANLLLMREDPTQTILAYDEIVKVILHGQLLDRSELTATARAGLSMQSKPMDAGARATTCQSRTWTSSRESAM